MDAETSRELLAMLAESRAQTMQAKLPRKVLSRPVLVLMILLRVYVFLAIPVVGYAFVHAMGVK